MPWRQFFEHHGVTSHENTFLPKTNLFKPNYSKLFWETHHDLVYRIYLKHPNSIQKLWKARTKHRSRFWQNTISLFVIVALRTGSILENNDIPFCGCCPAGDLDFENSWFLYSSNFLQVAKLGYLFRFEPREYATQLSFEKCCRMHKSTSQMDVWSLSYDHEPVSRWASKLVSRWASEPVSR